MTEAMGGAILAIAAVGVVLIGIVVLGFAAMVWAKALSLAVNARLHGKQVDAFGASNDVEKPEDDAPDVPKLRGTTTDLSRLTGDDIEAAIRAGRPHRTEADDEDEEFERGLSRGEVRTTDGNSGYDDDQPPVPGEPVVRAG